jgi:DNA-binding CsgD family transcriptional regulator
VAGETAGDTAAPADPLARFGLTEREREILELLAAGRSNPQIAESLFISPKTASVHVSNILAKLGVDSRVEAAAVAHRLGITGHHPRGAALPRNLALVVLVYDRTHSAPRLVGADIMCSFLYGTQTVLLLLVSRHVGLGAQGYGYMFAAIGAGGLIGTALAGRASRSSRPHLVQAAALPAR